jgi:hypothetical protein
MTYRALLMSLFFVSAAAACNTDDTTLTVQVQSRVNHVLDTDSTVDVSVRGGVATLSGLASSEAARTRAEGAARTVEGVRGIRDEISVPRVMHTTGATVPAPGGSVTPLFQ